MPEQVLQAGETLPISPSLSECRVYSRQACNLSAACLPVSAWGRKDARWPATISDISQGGIRLIVARRFEPGAGLGIELPGTAGEEPYTVLAKVVHVQGLPDGSWALGCKFISELSEDEVQRLLPTSVSVPQLPVETAPEPIAPSQHLQAAASSALQQDASGNQKISEVNLQFEAGQGRVIECRIRRLSVPGAWPLSAGTTLALRTKALNSPLSLLRLVVVRCFLQAERWILRCRLLNPLTDELLSALCRPDSPA
jgi:hypothetical protein